MNLAIISDGGDTGKNGLTDFDPWPYLVNKSVILSGISADVRLDESFAFNADEVSLRLKDDGGKEDRLKMDIVWDHDESIPVL